MKDKKQLDRFKETAREIGADTSDDALDKVMGNLDLTKRPLSESIDKGEKPRK